MAIQALSPNFLTPNAHARAQIATEPMAAAHSLQVPGSNHVMVTAMPTSSPSTPPASAPQPTDDSLYFSRGLSLACLLEECLADPGIAFVQRSPHQTGSRVLPLRSGHGFAHAPTSSRAALA